MGMWDSSEEPWQPQPYDWDASDVEYVSFTEPKRHRWHDWLDARWIDGDFGRLELFLDRVVLFVGGAAVMIFILWLISLTNPYNTMPSNIPVVAPAIVAGVLLLRFATPWLIRKWVKRHGGLIIDTRFYRQ